jgi:hypothetical protein
LSRCAARLLLALALALASACAEREGPARAPLIGEPVDDGGPAADAGPTARRRDGGARRDGGPAASDGGQRLPPEVIVLDVLAFNPARGPANGGTEIAISGRGFVAGTTVTIGTRPLADLAIQGERRITGKSPPGEAGVAPVFVENQVGRIEVVGGFTYVAPVALSGVVPSRGPARGGTELTVEGSGFLPGCALLVGSRPAFDVRYLSPSRLAAVAPEGTPGPTSISVVCREGSATLERAFTFFEDPALTAVDPGVGPLVGGNTARVVGQGLERAIGVFFGAARSPSILSRDAQEVRVVVPGSALPGPVDVTVQTADGVARLAGGYAYAGAGPELAVHGVVPSSGSTAGGTEIRIAGAAFDSSVFEVRVGAGVATALALEGAGVLRAVTPPGSPGPADVTVLASGARSAGLSGGFVYEPDLVLRSVMPASGPVAGGTEVALYGEGFADGIEVFFGPVAAPLRAPVEAGRLRVRAPAGAAGPVDVRLRHGSRVATLAGGFTYYDLPRLYRLAPDRGAVAGGTFVTFTGSGFTSASRPFFNGAPAVEVSLVDTTTLTARSPPGAVGPADVVVLGERGAAYLRGAFTYFDPISANGGTSGGRVTGSVNVTVIDGGSGERLAGSFVTLALWGTTRYQGLTDRNGQIVFSGPDLLGRQVVTAAHEGYSAVTVVFFDAENVTLFLNPLSLSMGLAPGPNLATIRGVLRSAFKGIPSPPEGYRKVVLVTTTLADRFTPNPTAPGVVEILRDDGREDRPYQLSSRSGDVAVYALAGHMSNDGTRFVPYFMGIRRYLFVPAEAVVDGVDLTIDAALNATLEARLLHAPPLLPDGPNAYRVRVFLELGSDGVVAFFQIAESTDEPRVLHEHLPVLSGSVAGSSFTVVGGAYNVVEGQEYSPLTQETVTGLTSVAAPLSIGPLMAIPSAVSPLDAEYLEDGRFAWGLTTPPEPNLQLVYLMQPVGLGLATIWEVIVPGGLREARLPDLAALAGLTGIPPYEVFYWAIVPAQGPAFSIDAFDYRAFDLRRWRSYSIAPYVFLTR